VGGRATCLALVLRGVKLSTRKKENERYTTPSEDRSGEERKFVRGAEAVVEQRIAWERNSENDETGGGKVGLEAEQKAKGPPNVPGEKGISLESGGPAGQEKKTSTKTEPPLERKGRGATPPGKIQKLCQRTTAGKNLDCGQATSREKEGGNWAQQEKGDRTRKKGEKKGRVRSSLATTSSEKEKGLSSEKSRREPGRKGISAGM